MILEDEYTVVEIKIKEPTWHISEINQLARGAAAALGFHFNSIKEYLPNEDDLDEMFQEIASELDVDNGE
jgi:AAA+ ATPase superfamily predicted ATPase